jgi:hypothetical protein
MHNIAKKRNRQNLNSKPITFLMLKLARDVAVVILPRVRFWIRRQVTTFFVGVSIVGLFILAFAGILYFNAVGTTSSIKPNLSGFAIARNETNVIPQSLTLSLNIDPPEFSFDYSCGGF